MKSPSSLIERMHNLCASLCDKIEALEEKGTDRASEKAEFLRAQADAIGEAIDALEGADWDE